MEVRKGKRYLQPYQVDYIKDNHTQLTNLQMATAIGCSQPTVWGWCRKLRIKPTKTVFQFKAPVIPVCQP